MIRLYDTDDESERMELTRRALQDFYSNRITPRREHPDSIGAVPSNRRDGALTCTEYDLVEIDCTMSGRLAVANIAGRRAYGLECLQEQDTSQLPVLPDITPLKRRQPETPAAAPEWEEATPEEMADRATEGTALLMALLILIACGIGLYYMIGGVNA